MDLRFKSHLPIQIDVLTNMFQDAYVMVISGVCAYENNWKHLLQREISYVKHNPTLKMKFSNKSMYYAQDFTLVFHKVEILLIHKQWPPQINVILQYNMYILSRNTFPSNSLGLQHTALKRSFHCFFLILNVVCLQPIAVLPKLHRMIGGESCRLFAALKAFYIWNIPKLQGAQAIERKACNSGSLSLNIHK